LATSTTGEGKLTINNIYRHIVALGAVALILGAGVAHAQSFIYGNSAGDGMYKIDASTGVVAAACSQSKGNGRGIVVVSNVVYFTVANSGNVYKTNFATCSDDGIAFAVPGSAGLSAIAYDGTNFWVGDYTGSNKAYYVSPAGALLKTVTLANCTGFCDGLEFYNGKLISNRVDGCCGGTPVPYDVYDTNGNLLTAAFLSVPNLSTGIAFDGTNFFTSDIFNQKLQVYNGTTGAFIKTVTITGMTLSNQIEDLSADYSVTLGPPADLSVPTMTEWGMFLMAGLLAMFGIFALRRRMR
jgi:hypothetical protein